jgi:hypothetical protein
VALTRGLLEREEEREVAVAAALKAAEESA